MSWDRLRVSHFASAVAIGTLAASTGQMFVGFLLPLWLRVSLSLTTFVVLVACLLGIAYHAGRLCHDCLASLPLDPAARVTAKINRLRFVHSILDHKPTFFVIMVVLIFGSASTSMIGFCAGMVLNLLGIYFILSTMTHSRLQPWCPWCREGGEEWFTPDHTPRDHQFA